MKPQQLATLTVLGMTMEKFSGSTWRVEFNTEGDSGSFDFKSKELAYFCFNLLDAIGSINAKMEFDGRIKFQCPVTSEFEKWFSTYETDARWAYREYLSDRDYMEQRGTAKSFEEYAMQLFTRNAF